MIFQPITPTSLRGLIANHLLKHAMIISIQIFEQNLLIKTGQNPQFHFYKHALISAPTSKIQYISMRANNNQCYYGHNCQRKNCRFIHPSHNSQPSQYSHSFDNRLREEANMNQYYRGGQQGHRNQYNPQSQRSKSKVKFEHPRYPNHYRPQNYRKPLSKKVEHNQFPLITYSLQKGICKFFHCNNACKLKQNCNRSHDFLFGHQEKQNIKRLVFDNSLPLDRESKMTAYVNNDRVAYFIRARGSIYVVVYAPFTNDVQQVKNMPLPQQKPSFFGSQNVFVFLAYHKSFYDLAILNTTTETYSGVLNAHVKKITGVAQISENFFISSSLDGELKIWQSTEESLVYQPNNSSMLKQQFNPSDQKIEHNFIHKAQVGSQTIFFIGTNCSSILLIIQQEQVSYSTIFVDIPNLHEHASIVNMKLAPFGDEQNIIVHAVARERQYILIYNLSQMSNWTVLVQESISIEFHTFDVFGRLLCIGGSNGVMIYDLTNMKNAIGGILHKSDVKSIAISQVILPTTGMNCEVLALLEPKNDDVQDSGLFSIYRL